MEDPCRYQAIRTLRDWVYADTLNEEDHQPPEVIQELLHHMVQLYIEKEGQELLEFREWYRSSREP